MDNRRRILDAARRLYNEMGLQKVTARAICKELGISPGSFSYHFPDSKLIVYNLFEEMHEEYQAMMQDLRDQKISVLTYLETHRRVLEIQLKYKFFYLNLIEILGSHPEIKSMYLADLQRDREMARAMIAQYIQEGVLRDDLSTAAMERMIDVGQILNNFWALDAEIMPKTSEKAMRVHYMKICCGLLEPYLTSDSLQAYQKYFADLEA